MLDPKRDSAFPGKIVEVPNLPKPQISQNHTQSKPAKKDRPLLRGVITLTIIAFVICIILSPIAIFNYFSIPTVSTKEVVTCIYRETGNIRVKQGMILYGKVYQMKENGDTYIVDKSIKTPFLTSKAIIVSTDSFAVVFRDTYNLGDGKVHVSSEQDKVLKRLLGELYVLDYEKPTTN